MLTVARKFLYALARTNQIKDPRVRRTWRLEPAFSEVSQVADVINRLQWYLPADRAIDVRARWKNGNNPNPNTLPIPENQLAYARHLDIRWESEWSPGSTILWDVESHLSRTLLRTRGQTRIVDPQFWSTAECNTHLRLAYWDTWSEADRAALRAESSVRLHKLTAQFADVDRVYLFGTGPSLTGVAGSDFQDGVRVVCNSIVRSPDLLKEIEPNIIVAADPVFHYGPSRYAGQFRTDLVAALDEYNAWFVGPAEYAATLVSALPRLRPRLIALDTHRSRRFIIPTPDSPRVRATGNVMTGFMLPLGLAIGTDLVVAGCDGRNPKDGGFWAHAPAAQYGDMYQSVAKTHPSFFRDRDYTRYYDAYTRAMADLLGWAEDSLGATIVSSTPSVIPALSNRMA